MISGIIMNIVWDSTSNTTTRKRKRLFLKLLKISLNPEHRGDVVDVAVACLLEMEKL